MNDVIPIKPAGVKITSANRCGFCTAKCCKYVTQRIDGPRSMEDFDVLLWQLSHPGVEVYKDSEGWFLIFNSTCRYLAPDGRCGIYATRPKICRDYSNDACEFDEVAENNFELYFRNDEELLRYCRKRYKNWDQRLE